MKEMLSMRVICLLVLALLLPVCQGQVAPPQEMQSDGLQTYRGPGFSLQYPANARVETKSTDPVATGEIHIVGPQVAVKPGDADWVYGGPAYELIVQVYDNPQGLDAESWARNYILTSWRQAKERGGPLMGPPVSETGQIEEQHVGRAVVAGQPAFWANFFAGDSYRRVFFVVHQQQVVALSFYDYPLANQPLATVQQDVYALIMGTFRFEDR
jgi:hypothetical protein